jgi:quercetin dioxygenase-like cupin family protein
VASLDSQNIETPHETRPFAAHGKMDVVTLGDFTMGKGTFEPGWRWSEDVKPITGICVSGRMTVRMDDGSELTIGPGDVAHIPPGHDAWVIGDEACVMYDTGVAAYAKPQ